MNEVAMRERPAVEPPSAPVPAPADAPDGVFLIHGLGGTQYDLGSMHKRLKNAGFVTHSLTLPGHGTKPEDLAGVTAEDWIDCRGRQVSRSARPASEAASHGHVHGLAARGGGRATREAHERQPRAAGAARVHRRLGHAVVSRAASAAVRGTGHRAHDEDRGRGSVRHQERTAAGDRQGEVRARREFPLPVGAARMHPAGRPVARAFS